MTSQHKDLTSQHKDLTRRQKDLTSHHNFLTIDGRNIPPYNAIQITAKLSYKSTYYLTSRLHYLTCLHNIWQVNIIVLKDDFLVVKSTCHIIILTCQNIMFICQIMMSTFQISVWQVGTVRGIYTTWYKKEEICQITILCHYTIAKHNKY